MNFENTNNNTGFEKALEIIRRDSKNRSVVSCCFGPTGPAGGPTGPTHPVKSGNKLKKYIEQTIYSYYNLYFSFF